MKAAGRRGIKLALLLYFALQEKSTPAWAKTVIVGALAYFIMPIDAIPDMLPGVGYSDDMGVLAVALATVAAHVDSNVRSKANQKLLRWFPES